MTTTGRWSLLHGNRALVLSKDTPNYLLPLMVSESQQKRAKSCCAPDTINHTRSKQLSHTLSWALRHKALELGLTMTPDGYVPVQEILNCKHAKFRGYTLEDIRQVVETNDKQRFKLEDRPATSYYPNQATEQSILCIRANQGHSIHCVNSDLLLERLDAETLSSLPIIVHGTYSQAWDSIQHQGLRRMSRNHIHFASGMPHDKDNGVISGMRRTCDVYIHVDAKKCAQDNIVFFRSENGVLLSAGVHDDGILPPEYFLKVVNKAGTVLLEKTESLLLQSSSTVQKI